MPKRTYYFENLVAILNGQIVQMPNPEAEVSRLLIDSRKIVFPQASLFFALVGQRNDGHDYLEAAYQAGVRNFVISKKVPLNKLRKANILIVPDSLRALQNLAANHRQKFKIPVIGITGSNGKTTVKEWLFQLLSADYNIVRSPKSYNSQVGVPLSVWELQPAHELAIFEAGISQVHEMENIAPIINCTIGLFTHLGPAHSEGFKDEVEKMREKARLFKSADVLIYSLDQQVVVESLRTFPKKQHFTWSTQNHQADLFIHNIQKGANQTRITARYKDQAIHLPIPFSDQAAIENTIHCWATLLYLGYAQDLIAERVQNLQRVAMRLELKAGIHNCILINDSYNLDLASLEIALDFMVQQGQREKRSIILSDILQSGLSSKALYLQVANLLLEKGINRLIAVGSTIGQIEPMLSKSIAFHHYTNTVALLHHLPDINFDQEAILIKGARVFAFERVVERLAQQAHQTVLEVNLNALINNLNIYARLLKPATKLMVMVKAAGYGSGAVEVARLLAFHQVDYLGVAYTDEGVVLRKAGIELPILVLNPEKSAFDSLIRYNLEPEIYSLNQLQQYLDFAPTGHLLPIHIKLDTGMHRLGFERQHLDELLRIIKQHPQLQVKSIFSHLVGSDVPEHDVFSLQQINVFQSAYRRLSKSLKYRPLRHLLNTGGILRFPQHQMDMVRLGVGLYGIDTSGSLASQISVVNTLKASISQIKNLPPGETIGYNRSGQIDRASRIATVSIGYADGLPRAAGQGRFQILIQGKLAPTVGNICMDMCMVDVTDIPEAREGDEAVIFGELPTVEELATCCGTIPYEIFTNISERVKRVYFQE